MNPSTRDVSRTEACGYSVRLDWPDGTHTFSRFAAARGRAERLAQKDIEFWSRSPYKPLEYRIVETVATTGSCTAIIDRTAVPQTARTNPAGADHAARRLQPRRDGHHMSVSLVTVNMPDGPIQPLPLRRPGSGCPVRPLLEA